MRYNVTIETHKMEDGSFRAYVVGSLWIRRLLRGEAPTREQAYLAARVALQTAYLDDTFSFVHAES